MEKLVRRQQSFEGLVATILARFASSVASDIDCHTQDTLREIGQFVGIDYAFVTQTATDSASWSVTHEWYAPGAPSQLANYQNVPMGTFDWAERVILAGETLLLNFLDDIPPEATEFRRLIEVLGFRSTLQLPLRGGDGLVHGCIALSSLQDEVRWTEADIQRLRLVGEAIANALQRKRIEDELRISESLYRATFEQVPVGILNMGVDGRVLTANQRLCDMLDYKREEILGMHYREFTHADDFQVSANMYDALLTDRTPRVSLENRYLRKDGGVVWGNLTMSILCGEASEPNTIIAAVEDVTDRKQAEETFDAVPDLIFVLDRQHRIVRANRAAAERLNV